MFRLLICDDHPPIRTAVRLLAREAAGMCDVTEASTAQELLQALRSRRVFDLLTLDLQLPDRNGLDVLADVKALRPELPVMVLSADDSDESVTRALRAGASSYLFKGCDEEALRRALADACSNRITLPVSYKVAGAGAAPPRHVFQVDARASLGLTSRQEQVLDCLLRGMSAKQIARALDISDGTVKTHTVAVFRALNVNSRLQAVYECNQRGITIGP